MSHALGSPVRPLEGGEIEEWKPGDAARYRLYHLDPDNPDPLHRRMFGPLHRFDHHLAQASGEPQLCPEGRRTVTYLGDARDTVAAEVFWDQGETARVCPRHRLAQLRPTATIKLLDLTKDGCDAIGALPALTTGNSTDGDAELTQEWARAIYEDLEVEGILYPGAHQFGECTLLFESAAALELVVDGGEPVDFALQDGKAWEQFKAEYTVKGRRRIVQIDSSGCPRCNQMGLPVLARQDGTS